MLFFLLLIPLVCFIGMSKSSFSAFHRDYMGKDQSKSIKGLFAVLVLLSHLKKYLSLEYTVPNWAFLAILEHIGQLMVVMFFFYSGYGIIECLRSNPCYKESFFRKRIIKTLLHYDIAVTLFLIVDLVLGISYKPSDYIFCWIGWKGIGNSKWFIFDILSLYSITLLSLATATGCKEYQTDRFDLCKFVAFFCSVGTAIFVVFMYFMKKDEGRYWYDTLITFPFGMVYSILRSKYEIALQRSRITWLGG